MDDKKKRVLFIAGILVLIAILLLLFWPREKTSAPPREETPAAAPAPAAEPSLVAPLVERSVPSPTQASAEAVARTFAERFASFSAESRFANIRDLYPVMTDRFVVEQEGAIAIAPTSNEYYGVTSKIVSLTTVSLENGSAVIEASLQRIEARGSAQNAETKYETLRLDLVFENGTWLVDGVAWSK